MIREWKLITASVLIVLGADIGKSQTPQFATLDIEWENYVAYLDDLADPSRLATSPAMVNANFRNFRTSILIGDIVSVNGRPAKGVFVIRGQLVQLSPNPMPGQAIGDIGRPFLGDYHVEILQTDGTPIGSIMSSGFGSGPAPPGAVAGLLLNLTVTGGTGAFVGARGFMTSPPFTVRSASMEEDPANRRTHGGGRGRFIVYMIPLTWPEIVTTASGPAVFHADFSPVNSSRPARAGEILIVRATGLGPTRPALAPGMAFPENPLLEVNSPVDVIVNGKSAEVVNKVGWPGTTDTYRLDIRVPDGTAPGTTALQLTTAFIPGRGVSVPVQ